MKALIARPKKGDVKGGMLIIEGIEKANEYESS